jgi:PncC family amidohydrolase
MSQLKPEYRLGEILKERNLTICTAESCTGGLIAHRITDIAGSSSYMLGGIVAYSNEIKQRLLNVKEQTLIDFGAVSQQTAAEMASGAQLVFGADYALSVTGIAGPGGATEEKPLGLTYIGLAGPDGLLIVERYVWSGDREDNKLSSAEAALHLFLQTPTT